MIDLRMLCWKGYKPVLAEHAKELAELNVRVKVTEDLDADRILRKFTGSTDCYDIVIVDWEYRHKYERLVLPIADKHVFLSGYLEPFRDRYWYEVGSRLSFVPLRFGTNGFVFHPSERMKADERFKHSLHDLLMNDRGSEGAQRAGLWNWWLPNMLLLARAEGFDPPHELTNEQLRHLTHDLLRRYLGAIKGGASATGPVVFSSLLDIISYGVSARDSKQAIDWILGPSEMVVAPVSHAKRLMSLPDTLEWDIPREGGLVWLETAALSRDLKEDRSRLEAAYRLLDFLQSPPIQMSLICGAGTHHGSRNPGGYWSYVLNNSEGLDRIPRDFKSVFHNQFFEKSAIEFGRWVTNCLNAGSLVMRALPANVQEWKISWREALRASAL